MSVLDREALARLADVLGSVPLADEKEQRDEAAHNGRRDANIPVRTTVEGEL